MNRRDFLKKIGVGAGATGLALVGCDSADNAAIGDRKAIREVPTDKMTYRVNPNTEGSESGTKKH